MVVIFGRPNGGVTVTLLEARFFAFLIVSCLSHEICYLGVAGDWQDDGVCTSIAIKAGSYVTAHYESKSVPLKVPVQTPAGAGPKSKNSRFFHTH